VIAGPTAAFTVRREYYDQIVAGTKTVEIRKATSHWVTLARHRPTRAVFLCGFGRVHWRVVTGATVLAGYGAAEQFLGRPLSEQGIKDVGHGPVVVFHLGEALAPPRRSE
jgi:hypothetical protein